MAQSSAMPLMTAPEISQAQLTAFHDAHFSGACVAHFSTHFIGPATDNDPEAVTHEPTKGEYDEEIGEYWYEEEGDDGLGYYEDGVKRTLTDAEIAIFRHSEIQQLVKARRLAAEAREDGELDEDFTATKQEAHSNVLGESNDAQPIEGLEQSETNSKKKRKKNKGRQVNPKPDLRKRTWDIVEKSTGELDYGDNDAITPAASTRGPQRRKISYEDD